MQKNWFKLAAFAAALACGGTAQAAVIYNDGYTDGTGEYHGVGSVLGTYTSATAQSAAFSFELFGARTVDGTNGYDDVYSVDLNGTTVFEGIFNLGGGGGDDETFPNGFTSLIFNFGYGKGGKVLVSGFVDLMAGLNTFTFTFSSPGPNNGSGHNQGTGDESWGVNNAVVDVAAVPLPAALPLLGGAIAGLGALGLRRRKATA